MKWFRIFVLSFLGLIALLVAIWESGPGQRWIQSILIERLQKEGLGVEIGSISGRLPQAADLENVRIHCIFNRSVVIEKLHIELSPLRLLLGTVAVDRIEASGIWITKEASPCSAERDSLAKLAFTVAIRSFSAKEIHLDDFPVLEANGEAKVKKRGKGAYLIADVRRPDFPETTLHLVATKRKERIEAEATLDTPNAIALQPWAPFTEGSLHGAVSLKGTSDTFIGKISGTSNHLRTTSSSSLLDREWAFRSRFQKTKEQRLSFYKFLASAQGLRVQGSGQLDSTFHLTHADLLGRVDLATLPAQIPLEGVVFGSASWVQNTVSFSWHSGKISIGQEHVEKLSGSGKGHLSSFAWNGNLAATGKFLGEEWKLQTNATLRKGDPLIFENVELQSPLLELSGNLTLRPDAILVGKFDVLMADLILLERWRNVPATGMASGTVRLEEIGEEQKVRFSGLVQEGAYDGISARKVQFELGENDAFHVELSQGKWRQLQFPSAILDTTLNQGPKAFSAKVEGERWNIGGIGTWDQNKVQVGALRGKARSHSISLQAPVTIEFEKERFSLRNLSVAIGSGRVLANLSKTKASVQLIHFPLDLLSLGGETSGSLDLSASLGKNGNGKLEAAITSGEITIPGENPIHAEGTLSAQLEKHRIHVRGNMEVNESPFLAVVLDAPLEASLWPPRLELPRTGAVSGNLSLHGAIEDVLDFVNLGMHRLEGDCDFELKLRGTVESPIFEGGGTIQNGYYENYLTGTELIDINAKFLGDGPRLRLGSLTAQDAEEKGSFAAKGEISFFPKLHFHFDANFAKLRIVQIDLLTAAAKGHVSIDGDRKSATASGEIGIVESLITIPDRIPRSLPDLIAVYKNARSRVTLPPPPKPPYPLQLELQVKTENPLIIAGRGLNSKWNGEFAVGGTFAEPTAAGKLELLTGEFAFAGRHFKLIEGALVLQGKEYEMPHINIAANIFEHGISITARLTGPLNHPQLTFQSSPPLPLSSILSYLLFGKDLSDVTGLQALQLAGTVASVAGEGPDILEITRKSLGVDRLQIVMAPSGPTGETIALSVGKVLVPGVILTVRQTADDTAPNLGIEIDLTHGFSFEAESEQNPEQGKFSLKWNLNY